MRLLREPYRIYTIAASFFAGLIFSFATTVYFSADDFYNMKLILHHSIGDVFRTFLFERREDYLYYRPLTTQLYLYLGQKIFGLNPWLYHMASAVGFAVILALVYQVAIKLTNNPRLSIFTLLFYTFSASNFSRLAWISQMQEIGFALISLLAIFFWIKYLKQPNNKDYRLSLVMTLLALMSKETAVILPLLFLTVLFIVCKPLVVQREIKRLLPIVIILLGYLYLRFTKIGISPGVHYFTDYNLFKMANTGLWYILWSFGVPELFVNFKYFGGPTIINQRVIQYLLTDMSSSFVAFGLLFLWIFVLVSFFILTQLKMSQKASGQNSEIKWLVFGIMWFIFGLLPHLFSPFHKFPYELTLPLFGYALSFAAILVGSEKMLYQIFPPLGRVVTKVTMVLYVTATLTSLQVEAWNSWIIQRGIIAQKVTTYLKMRYPTYPEGKKIIFYNDVRAPNTIMGVSRQIQYALAGSAATEVVYYNDQAKVYYEDDGLAVNACTRDLILLPSTAFIPYN